MADRVHQELQRQGVVLFEDNDAPGRRLAEHVSVQIHPVADSVRLIAFLNEREKLDITNWVKAHDPEQLIADLERMIETASSWKPLVQQDRAAADDSWASEGMDTFLLQTMWTSHTSCRTCSYEAVSCRYSLPVGSASPFFLPIGRHVGLDFSDLLIEAGLGCGAQEATHCDPPMQNDARRARAAYYSERTIRCPHDSWRSRCHTRGHRQPRRGKFAFLFVAPVLNAVHGLLAGAAYFLCIVLDIRHGFTSSHGLIDYIVLFPKSHNALWFPIAVSICSRRDVRSKTRLRRPSTACAPTTSLCS
jgi:hypothetical protein